MTFTVDSQVGAALMQLAEAAGDVPPPPAGDWRTRRATMEASMAAWGAAQPMPSDVTTVDYKASAADGTPILLRWYTKQGRSETGTPGPAVLYAHGGGMIHSTVDLYAPVIGNYVSASGVPMLAVEYRRAPEHPHPTPVEDSYTGLQWLAGHSAELGVDPARIAVMGDSAGGGIAAGVALLARDRGGPALARQILVYPMLDDRTAVKAPDPAITPFLAWSNDDNITGWGALLGERVGGADVPVYAAPARVADPAGLPPTYIEVGTLDLFRDEDIEYARRLNAAAVPTELHVHPGVPHAFEAIAPGADVSMRSAADRIRVISSF